MDAVPSPGVKVEPKLYSTSYEEIEELFVPSKETLSLPIFHCVILGFGQEPLSAIESKNFV